MEQLSRNQVGDLRSLGQKKYRESAGEFLLEGVRLCEEALASPLVITQCIFSREHSENPIVTQARRRAIPSFQANKTQFEQFCDSQTPQGLAVVAKIPTDSEWPIPGNSSQLILALDRLADPGNVGTILRSARWFGVQDVILSEDCVDVFAPKVVRSSMGAVCFLRLHRQVNLQSFASHWQEQNGKIAVLSMVGNSLESFHRPDTGLMLITGSEAHGVDPEVEKLGTPLTIVPRGTGESLNAAIATSIGLWQLTR
ncbi:MAG: hypothetical protein COY19_04855 [Candidatus Marinimicrobia bacterium CG_4_10_14_0_2_um_filter_48_9]|nr:MAG: hypothetical protein COY19_04855 [Candidatus Marinimicrobia bacterium CG_4_10_14_0_2_um_filter_48_9]